jgi:hypothetical protein
VLAAPTRRHPLHRLDRGVPGDVADRRARTSALYRPTRGSSARPAARTSCSPTPRPTPTRWSDGPGARRLRVPGAEVLGGVARLRARVAVAHDRGEPARADRRHRDGRRPLDFRNFMGAVIDGRRSTSIKATSRRLRAAAATRSIAGGGATTRRAGSSSRPVRRGPDRSKLMREEIFGPVLTVFVYDDAELDETLELCDATSPYALTGAVFAQDRAAIAEAPGGCATPRATSTSTTSRPARWWASSRSAAAGRRAPTTRPARA